MSGAGVIAACALVPAVAAAAAPMVRLDHVGPQDAAVPALVFTLKANTDEARPRVVQVPVGPDKLHAMCSALAQPSTPPPAPLPTGTFDVTTRDCAAAPRLRIGPAEFQRLVRIAEAGVPVAGAAAGMDTVRGVLRLVRAANPGLPPN